MNDRLARCRAVLDDLGLGGVVVGEPADVRYLSGFRGDDTMLIISADVALICTDARFWEQAREEAAGFELVEAVGADPIADTVAAAAKHLGADAWLGFQGASLSYQEYRRLRRRHRGRLRDVGRRVSRLRVIKDAAEIDVMRRAGAVTDEALAAVVERGLVGRREADVAWDLLAEYHRLGAEGEAFPAIVAAGAHGAQAHAIPGSRVIAAGELVVIDTGARVDGYCSDITRTFAAGEPAPELRRVYDVVLAAQLAGLAAVRDGAHGRGDVDAAARAVIEAAGYGERFAHGTGHGVGLDVHEAPGLGRTRGDPLAAGMVCTVEPGIYIEGLAGVRIEDTVLVTATGGERLTAFSKELQVVG
ncbi:MAG: Xaa-Pro peptidase family protein [Actinobacteria bacterium]|nr:Xaa-Pro peptidase family protein [Actinomycetota bacterium]